jgi:DNA-directed RNA polymerase specialized sigma24 family protein
MHQGSTMTDALPRDLGEQRFAHLYRDHARGILGYALRRCPDPEDASDVVAETFLAAWRRLPEVPSGAEARLWLYGTARLVLANQRRGERDTTAAVDTRAELYVNQGGPGNRQMVAFWPEDGYVLELRAAVPDQAAFEERLGWLTKMDSQTWLDAMPAKVVKAADHEAAVREMLKGIPVPSTFKPSRVPDEGLTTTRYQVGAKVTSTVSCLWLLQWAEARRTGDREAELEAEQAMATSKHWRILREMAKEGGYPESIWQVAAEMPSGVWEHTGHQHPLLPRAEGLGCARLGLPLLPRKQKLQHERGAPPPPR